MSMVTVLSVFLACTLSVEFCSAVSRDEVGALLLRGSQILALAYLFSAMG